MHSFFSFVGLYYYPRFAKVQKLILALGKPSGSIFIDRVVLISIGTVGARLRYRVVTLARGSIRFAP